MNPKNVKFIQVCQGKNHILMLDTSGKVYSFGDNSFFQVCPEGVILTTDRNQATYRSQSDVIPGQSQRSQKPVSITKGDIAHERGTEFLDQIVEVPFGEYLSRSIYRIHAFNNTSIARDRSGDMYFWGENSLSDTYNPKPVKKPTILREFKKQKISRNSIHF